MLQLARLVNNRVEGFGAEILKVDTSVQILIDFANDSSVAETMKSNKIGVNRS